MRTEYLDQHGFIRICCKGCLSSFDVPIYCGDRFCPVCSYPRLQRVRKRIQHLARKVKTTKEIRTLFLTLTIRSKTDLNGMIRKLVKNFRKYRSTPEWKKAVIGGAFVIEITRNEGLWHAHLHLVIESRWMDFDVHQPIWEKISGGKGWYCKILPADQIVKYLSKYLSKPSVEAEDIDDVGNILSHYRLFQTFGSWYGGLADFTVDPRKCPKCGDFHYLPFDIIYRDLLEQGWNLDYDSEGRIRSCEIVDTS